MNSRYYLNVCGRTDAFDLATGKNQRVPFPVCLALKVQGHVSEACPHFVLNAARRRLFVKTDAVLPKGSQVAMHFQLPPESKLLGALRGEVVGNCGGHRASSGGLEIRILRESRSRIADVQHYLDGKRRLVDLTV